MPKQQTLPEPIKELCNLVLDGNCPVEHIRSGACIGRLKLYVYPWCGQHRIACDHCGSVVRIPGLHLDPMPRAMAEKFISYIDVVVMKHDESLSDIRRRFWSIGYEVDRTAKTLF